MVSKYLGGLFFVILVFPISLHSQTIEDEYKNTLLQLIEVLQKQIVSLRAQLTSQYQYEVVIVPRNVKSQYIDSNQVVASYRLEKTSDIGEIENNQHRAYFSKVFNLIPNDYAKKINHLLIFDGADVNYEAFVETIPPDHDKWSYAVHQNSLANPDSKQSTQLMVHEFGHIVSYEEISGVPKPLNSNCHDYYLISTSCPLQNSYLGQFAQKFWTESDLDRVEKIPENDHQALWQYYKSHEDKYVNEYAVAGPEEDFAESFMFYVFNLSVAGQVSQAKIDFLASFPHLQQLKNHVENNL